MNVENPEPTLAFDRDDVGMMLRSCGSLVYKGGFVPQHLIEDGLESSDIDDQLHFEETLRPLQVIKNEDTARGNSPWPLSCWPAHIIPRERLEDNPQYLQTLPYILVFDDNRNLLIYNRASGDPRLTNSWSIGIGGHVDIGDVEQQVLEGDHLIDVPKTLQNAAQREFHEEIGMVPPPSEKFYTAGLLHHPDDDVGQVHLGVVMSVVVDSESLQESIGESEEVGEYKMLNEDDDVEERLDGEIENWSKILFHTEVPSVLRAVWW